MLRTNAPWDAMPHLSWLACDRQPQSLEVWAPPGLAIAAAAAAAAGSSAQAPSERASKGGTSSLGP